MTDIKNLIERLITAKDDDHERGCQMRFAMCTCGFDDACARTAGEAADAILALGRERDALRSQVHQLADFIMNEVPGEPSLNEGAVECAIRIIRTALEGTKP